MDVGLGLKCTGCGSSSVTFDPRQRLMICDQCGKTEFFSRSTLNRNGKVVYCKENAIRCFKEGHYEEAKRFALDIMNISIDDIMAKFIIAFCNEIVSKDQGELERFFDGIKDEMLDYDEVRNLITVISASVAYLKNYEKMIVKIIAVNMKSEEDKKELCDFVDLICPYCIAQRSSIAFLDAEMAELYGDLAEHCTIPKTCFSLIKAIETNNDSPYAGNTFGYGLKTRHFYDYFVVPIGGIINRMVSEQWKKKFEAAYEQKLQDYKQKAGF